MVTGALNPAKERPLLPAPVYVPACESHIEFCQGRPAVCREFNYMVDEIPRQGRRERVAIQWLLQCTWSADWTACNE